MNSGMFNEFEKSMNLGNTMKLIEKFNVLGDNIQTVLNVLNEQRKNQGERLLVCGTELHNSHKIGDQCRWRLDEVQSQVSKLNEGMEKCRTSNHIPP